MYTANITTIGIESDGKVPSINNGIVTITNQSDLYINCINKTGRNLRGARKPNTDKMANERVILPAMPVVNGSNPSGTIFSGANNIMRPDIPANGTLAA